MGGRELGDCADCDSDKTVRGGGWGEVKGFDIGAERKSVSPSSARFPLPPLPILEFAHEQEIQADYVHCIFKQTNTALFSLPFSFFFVHLNSVALERQEKRRVVLYAQR